MEPLTSFMDEEVLKGTPPSIWLEITLPWPVEPALWDCNHSRSCQACPKGPCQWPMVRHSQCYIPPPLARWLHRPLWPGRWCHNWQSLKVIPNPSTRVCRDCMIPAGGQPAISHCQDPSWRGWPPSPYEIVGSTLTSDLTDPTPHHRKGAPGHDQLHSWHSGSGALPCSGGPPGHSPRGASWQWRLGFPLEMSGAYSPTSKICSCTIWCVCHNVCISACSVITQWMDIGFIDYAVSGCVILEV